LDKLNAAIADFREAVDKDPENPKYRIPLCRAMSSAGKVAQALLGKFTNRSIISKISDFFLRIV